MNIGKTHSPLQGPQIFPYTWDGKRGVNHLGALWLDFVTPLALFWDSSLSVATSVGVVYGWTVRDG